MELRMIEGKTSKDQRIPPKTITEDRKAGIEKVARSFEQPPRMFGSRRLRDMSKYCHFHEDHGHETNDCRQLRSHIEEAVKSGQLSHLMKGIKKERAKASENQRVEGKKDKGVTPTEAPILMIRASKIDSKVSLIGVSGEKSWSSREIPLETMIGDAPLARRETLKFVIVRSDSPYNMLLGRTTMQKMGIVVSTVHEAIKFHTAKGIKTVFSTYESDKIKEGMKKVRETPPASTKGVLSCTKAEEKVVINDIYPGQTITIEKQLPEHFKERPRDLLSHIKPVKQKRRGLGPDRSTTACKEVEELTKVGILQKVKHQTWVANPIMAKKSNGGWRMCVDFTDINKACPKDCYPLPEIDWKVESLLGFRLKCFLDAYKGYHHIQMAKEDEDKTDFFAGERVFCYRKMPFGLKNAGATYQRLVDKVFHDQIGRNLEAYVDDMVIKSTFEEDMLADIKKLLKGIRANPSKVKAITDVEQPKTLKDIQSLNGKLVALSRFLLRGAKRSIPFCSCVAIPCDLLVPNSIYKLIKVCVLRGGSCVAIPCDLLVPNSIYKLIKVCVLRGGIYGLILARSECVFLMEVNVIAIPCDWTLAFIGLFWLDPECVVLDGGLVIKCYFLPAVHVLVFHSDLIVHNSIYKIIKGLWYSWRHFMGLLWLDFRMCVLDGGSCVAIPCDLLVPNSIYKLIKVCVLRGGSCDARYSCDLLVPKFDVISLLRVCALYMGGGLPYFLDDPRRHRCYGMIRLIRFVLLVEVHRGGSCVAISCDLLVPNSIYKLIKVCALRGGSCVAIPCDLLVPNSIYKLIKVCVLRGGSCVAIPCDLLVPNSIYKLIKVCVLRGGLLLS
ncbi:reverse transcriptase domain-containing protein [Tanacetum coccineum]